MLYIVRAVYTLTNDEIVNNPRLQLYFGSFFNIFNVEPFHIETLMGIWAANYLVVTISSSGYRLKDFRWLDLIRMLEGTIPPSRLSISLISV